MTHVIIIIISQKLGHTSFKKNAQPEKNLNMNEVTKKTPKQAFGTKIPEGTDEEVIDHLLKAATIDVPKIKALAKLYGMNQTYKQATKDTNKKKFLKALIKKLD